MRPQVVGATGPAQGPHAVYGGHPVDVSLIGNLRVIHLHQHPGGCAHRQVFSQSNVLAPQLVERNGLKNAF